MDEFVETRATQWFENLDVKINEILKFIEKESPPFESISDRVATLRDEIKKEEKHTFGFVLTNLEEVAFEFALFEIESHLAKALETGSCNNCFHELMDAETTTSYYLKQLQRQ